MKYDDNGNPIDNREKRLIDFTIALIAAALVALVIAIVRWVR